MRNLFFLFLLLGSCFTFQTVQAQTTVPKSPRTLFSKDSVTIIYWEKNYVRATNKIEETEKRISFAHKIPANEIYYGFHLNRYEIPSSISPCNLFSNRQEVITLDSLSIWNQKSQNRNIVNLATFDSEKLRAAFLRQLSYLRSSKGLKPLQSVLKLNQAAQTIASVNYSTSYMSCGTGYRNPTRPDLATAFNQQGKYYFESDNEFDFYTNELTYDQLAKKVLDYEMARKRAYNFMALNTVDFIGFGATVYELPDSCIARMQTAKLSKPLYNGAGGLWGKKTIYENVKGCGDNMFANDFYGTNYMYGEEDKKRVPVEKYHLEYSYASRKKLIDLLQKYNPQAIQFLSRNSPSYFIRPKNLLSYYYQIDELSKFEQNWLIESLAKYKTDQYGDFLEEPRFKGKQVVYKHALHITYSMIFKTSSYKENMQP